MTSLSNVTHDRNADADGDPPLRRRRSLPYIPTPLRALEWRYTSSNGSQGGGVNTSTNSSRGIGTWWPSSSAGTTTSSSSSIHTSSFVGGHEPCTQSSRLNAMDEDEAFFETYGILDEGGGRAGIRLAARQLAIGVRVHCTIGRAVNSCTLSIIGDGDQGFHASQGVSVRLMGVHSTLEGYLSVPLVDVSKVVCEPRGPRDVITCGLRKLRGGGSKILSVVCLDRHGAPAASLTKAVALVLAWNADVMMEAKGPAKDLPCAVEPEDAWQAFSAVRSGQALPSNGVTGGNRRGGSSSNGRGRSSNGHGREMGRCGGQFASVLEPAGLLIEYEGDFKNSGLDFEDLAMVERKDLEEIVGITDRLHQIKIMTQIRRRFQGAGSLGGEPSDSGSSSSNSNSSSGVQYTTSVIAGTAMTTTRRSRRLQCLGQGKMAGDGLEGDLYGDGSAGKTSEATPLL